ncbi:MAG: DUF86 domain-containing protein, partial [Parvularculaceae bacterium]|nr:DUF86 domain-containing protein [Parvularculaceae bacterium]
IRRWVEDAGGPEQALATGALHRNAIERQLLIISEAAIRLHRDSTFPLQFAPDFDWAGARGIGNVLRHRYDAIDPAIIIGVLTVQLPLLDVVCEVALASNYRVPARRRSHCRNSSFHRFSEIITPPRASAPAALRTVSATSSPSGKAASSSRPRRCR